MKRANSTGSITKLTGKRRKPYMARVTDHLEVDEENKKVRQVQRVIGYYATKREALDALETFHQNPVILDPAQTTFGQIWSKVIDKWKITEERRKSYISLYNRYVLSLDNMRIRDIRHAHMQDIIDSITQKSSTKVKLAAIFHKCFEYAIQNGLVLTDYSKYISFERDEVEIRRRIFSHDEVEELWNQEPEDDRDFTLCLLYSGLRIKELRELECQNIDFDSKMMSIVIAKNKRSVRAVPISDKILPIITAHYDKRSKYLFEVTKNHYEWYMKSCNHTAYDTRHSFATRCNELNIDKLIIQRIMGHTPESVLEQTYIHLKDEELLAAINTVIY